MVRIFRSVGQNSSDTVVKIGRNKHSSLSKVEVSKLFDRFYMVKNAKGSSGPGLSIARVLTEIMGGTIDSEINEGVLSIILMFKN